MKTFGERLRDCRIAAGLSQTALAGDDFSASYISLMEAGKRTPSPEVVQQLATKLGCSASELMDGRPSERDARISLELAFARLAMEHGEADEARRRLVDLLAERDISTRLRDEITVKLSHAYERLGDLAKAIAVLQSVFDRACEGDEQPATHLLPTVLGIDMTGLYLDSGDVSQAIIVGERALAAARAQSLTSTTHYYLLAATVMWAYVERGDFTHAELWTQSLLAAADQDDQVVGQAALYWNAALLAERQGRLVKALGLAERALAHLSEQDNSRDYARLRLDLAGLLLVTDPPQVARAANLLDRCIEDLRALGSPVDVSRWHAVMSEVRLHQGDVLTAEVHARQAVDLLRPGSSSLELAVALTKVHDTLVAQRREDADLLTGALAEMSAQPPTRLNASEWRALAERLATEDPALAMEAFRKALDAAGVRDRTSALRARVEELRQRPSVGSTVRA